MFKRLIPLLFLCACWGDRPQKTEPVLPESTIRVAPLSVGAFTGEVPKQIYPPNGAWKLQIEYAVSQRAKGQPDLDLLVSGTAEVTSDANGRLSATKLHLTARPDNPRIIASVEKSMPSFLQHLAPQIPSDASPTWKAGDIVWEFTGRSGNTIVLQGTGVRSKTWIEINEESVAKAGFVEMGDETRSDLNARQKWRISLLLN